MERVNAVILSRDYSLACSAEEKPTLQAAINHVMRVTNHIQASGRVSGNERIAVLAALQIASEMLSMKAPDGPLGSLALGDFKRRIEDVNQMIDAAMADGQSAS